jgi:hypothetical protein
VLQNTYCAKRNRITCTNIYRSLRKSDYTNSYTVSHTHTHTHTQTHTCAPARHTRSAALYYFPVRRYPLQCFSRSRLSVCCLAWALGCQTAPRATHSLGAYPYSDISRTFQTIQFYARTMNVPSVLYGYLLRQIVTQSPGTYPCCTPGKSMGRWRCSSLTSALYGVKVVSFTPRPFTHAKWSAVPTEQEFGWTPDPSCMFWRKQIPTSLPCRKSIIS